MNKKEENVDVFTFICEEKLATKKPGQKTTIWYTEKNGDFVEGSLSLNQEEAQEFYNQLISNGGEMKKRTTLRKDVIKKGGQNG